MADFTYHKAANREINTFDKYIEESDTNGAWSVMAMSYLLKAVVFALLDISQAIRDSSTGRSR